MKYIGENAIKKLISLIKGDLATKQPTITASGLLKGDGAGTVTAAETQEATLVDVPNGLLKGDGTTISAAVAEIDYMAPPTGGTTGQVLKKTENGTEWGDAPQTVTIPETTALLKGDGAGGVAAVTTDATPTQGSTNPVQSGGVYTALADKLDKTGDGSNVTAAFTAASSRTNIATGEKLSVLFGKIAKWFSDLGSLAFKSTVAKSDLASDVQTSLGKADSALQSVTKSDVGLGNVDNVKQYSASNPPPYPVTSVNGQTGDVEVQSGSEAASYTATLTISGWAQSGDRYSQTVNVTGVTASTPVVIVDVALSGIDIDADAASLEAWGIVSANNVAQGAGTLTFYALIVPSVNIPVNVGVC